MHHFYERCYYGETLSMDGLGYCPVPVVSNSSYNPTVNFEDLIEREDISGTTRYDIDWEFGNNGANGFTGSWAVPENPGDEYYYNSPHSGTKNIVNSWGCTEIGFQFLAAENNLAIEFQIAYVIPFQKGKQTLTQAMKQVQSTPEILTLKMALTQESSQQVKK